MVGRRPQHAILSVYLNILCVCFPLVLATFLFLVESATSRLSCLLLSLQKVSNVNTMSVMTQATESVAYGEGLRFNKI